MMALQRLLAVAWNNLFHISHITPKQLLVRRLVASKPILIRCLFWLIKKTNLLPRRLPRALSGIHLARSPAGYMHHIAGVLRYYGVVRSPSA